MTFSMYSFWVEQIRQVTHLTFIPVYFDDRHANCKGSPYFGIGEHCWEIYPSEFLDDPRFELSDFLTNEHVPYYHIGLPTKLFTKGTDSFIYKALEETLEDYNFHEHFTEESLEIYMILHEFGHAHEFFMTFQADVSEYLQNNCNSLRRYTTHNADEFKEYKKLPSEQYADRFATQHFYAVKERIQKTAIL